MEPALFVLALGAGLIGIIRSRSTAGRALAIGCVLVALGGALARAPSRDAALDEAIPQPHREDGFVGSATCRACHPSQFDTWHDSYHRKMTQPATPEAVLGDFDEVTLHSRGRTTRLSREGESFFVDVIDPLWDLKYYKTPTAALPPEMPRVRAQVVMTTGSHHLQTYWIRRPKDKSQVGEGLPADDGAIVQVPWLWHVEERRWIPTQDSFLSPPSDRVAAGMPWAGSCSPCHSVGTQPRLAGQQFDTRSAELGIACEACHGPGQTHVTANRNPLRRYLRHFAADPGDPTIVNPARLDKDASAQLCGQCHSFHRDLDMARARTTGVSFRPGDAIGDHKRVFERSTDPADPDLIEQLRLEPDALAGRFWNDGTIRIAGREYNGLLESPCHNKGEMTCLSCHSMHEYVEPADQLRPEARDDRACAECHAAIAADAAGHSHHLPGSSGAICVNCHMPHTTWGLFVAMRSHRIDVPRARISVATGRPNACNQCHLDQTLAWTGEHLAQWYGHEPLTDLPREHREVAASIVWALSGDAPQRAIAAWTMGRSEARAVSGQGWEGQYLARLLADPYASVRKVAYDSLRTLPGFAGLHYDFVPAEGEQQTVSRAAHQRWLGTRTLFLDRRGPAVLIGADGEPDERRTMELHARRDDTPVRIIE